MAWRCAAPMSCFPWSARRTRRKPSNTSTITSRSAWAPIPICSRPFTSPPKNWKSNASRRALSGVMPSACRANPPPKWKPRNRRPAEAEAEAEAEADGAPGRQVYRVKPAQKRKPMTVEEAMLEMDKARDYLVYRDAQTDRVNVLLGRRERHLDLVEG